MNSGQSPQQWIDFKRKFSLEILPPDSARLFRQRFEIRNQVYPATAEDGLSWNTTVNKSYTESAVSTLVSMITTDNNFVKIKMTQYEKENHEQL